jgi:nitrite reductase (NO-forming)
MPFFSAALAAAAPADPRLRIAGVALVAVGAAAVASRADPLVASGPLPAIGGLAFIGGMILVGLATVGAARRGLATRRRLVTIAYVAALLDVLGGATLGTLAVAGNGAVLVAWATLRPAHAWLNLLGFVTLVVAGTLLHLLPTIAGTRIVERASARVAIAGLVAGPPTVAGGFVIAALGAAAAGDVVVRVGAAIALAGAVALGVDSIAVARARGHWTSDAGWLVAGAVPDAWSTSLVAVALGLGWIAQAFIGSWTHLLPAIGPGGPTGHAVRRRMLARGAIPRLVALNVGVALLALGSGLQSDALAEIGLALAVGATVAALGLGAAALLDPLGRAVAGRG